MIRSPGSQDHPVLGRLLSRGLYINGQEGYCIARVNSLGMHNPEVGPKRPGIFRILVLGDSYTEGYQVLDSENYCRQLETSLRREFGPLIEVINGGRSGASPAYYLHPAEFYRATIQPDLVVVQLNERSFTHGLLATSEYFYAVQDGSGFKTVRNAKFVSTNPFTQRFPRLSFLTKISTLRVASERLAAARGKFSDAPAVHQSGEALDPVVSAGLDWSVAELHKSYPRLVLVYLPDINYDHPARLPSAVETRLQRQAERVGVPLVDLRPDFLAAFRATDQPACGFNNTQPGAGHINALGHSLTAARLGRELGPLIPR